MFVPSLSWQNDRFIYKWRKNGVFRRDHVTLCPDWADPDNQVELYDHRTDTTPLDLDSFENVNVATDAANAGVLQELTTQVHSLFGSRNCKRPTNSDDSSAVESRA